MVLDPAGAVDAAVDEHLKSFTMDSSNDPTMRFKSQTLPRNTKYYCDSGRFVLCLFLGFP